ncbi:hypothetical protein Cadr_000025757 [Camelus dromedarius]|uniref:Uncharacterized protein n=1 Tax=Camelus dromedarius TaxID=9838 RepID=A0A5N4CP23_CAMDR|nr:hypothetical protein Cadr_000025757 [Camelus dromedarius]
MIKYGLREGTGGRWGERRGGRRQCGQTGTEQGRSVEAAGRVMTRRTSRSHPRSQLSVWWQGIQTDRDHATHYLNFLGLRASIPHLGRESGSDTSYRGHFGSRIRQSQGSTRPRAWTPTPHTTRWAGPCSQVLGDAHSRALSPDSTVDPPGSNPSASSVTCLGWGLGPGALQIFLKVLVQTHSGGPSGGRIEVGAGGTSIFQSIRSRRGLSCLAWPSKIPSKVPEPLPGRKAGPLHGAGPGGRGWPGPLVPASSLGAPLGHGPGAESSRWPSFWAFQTGVQRAYRHMMLCEGPGRPPPATTEGTVAGSGHLGAGPQPHTALHFRIPQLGCGQPLTHSVPGTLPDGLPARQRTGPGDACDPDATPPGDAEH